MKNNTDYTVLVAVIDQHHCFHLNLVAVFCINVFCLSLFFNLLLLCLFCYHKHLRSSVNLFIVCVTVLNLLATLVEIPLVIISNLNCKLMFSHQHCVLSAFCMYFVGCSSIYLLCAISAERLYVIDNPSNGKRLTAKSYLKVICVCLLAGLFWSLAPLFGWSRYSLERSTQTSCSLEWSEKSLSVTSYNICIFIFVFTLPLLFICVCNLKILTKVIRWRKNSTPVCSRRIIRKKLQTERRVTINIMILIACFMLSWLPYGVISMYTAFTNARVLKIGSMLSAILAKTSMVWTTLLFIFLNEKLRNKMIPRFFQNSRTNS